MDVPRITMRPISVILLAGIITGLVLICGCTSTGPLPATTQSQSDTQNLTSQVKGMMLSLSDLPEGYSFLHEGRTIPADEAPSEKANGYRGGYTFSAATFTGNRTGDTFEQTVLVFGGGSGSRNLSDLFLSSFPQIASWSPVALSDPGLGDRSIGYRYVVPASVAPPNQTVSGTVVIFGKGDICEIIMVQGPSTNESYPLDLARKAAIKVK